MYNLLQRLAVLDLGENQVYTPQFDMSNWMAFFIRTRVVSKLRLSNASDGQEKYIGFRFLFFRFPLVDEISGEGRVQRFEICEKY